MPSTTLTPGFATDTAAIAVASWPVASESCWIRNAANPKPRRAQVARSVAVSPMLTCSSLMTGLSNGADNPNRSPAHLPRTAAHDDRVGAAARSGVTPFGDPDAGVDDTSTPIQRCWDRLERVGRRGCCARANLAHLPTRARGAPARVDPRPALHPGSALLVRSHRHRRAGQRVVQQQLAAGHQEAERGRLGPGSAGPAGD